MDALELKEKIIEDNKIIDVLEELGMHSIRDCGDYLTCGMPDGDRQNSTTIYKSDLGVVAYTRDIKDAYGISDIISLTSFINEMYFSHSLTWLCDICGYNYYGKSEPISKLAQWTKAMMRIKNKESDEVDESIEPLDECVLDYYGSYVTDFFKNDGIDYHTQKEFELGYDIESNYITIPIRDELGNLVGVKGRLFKEKVNDYENKYIYIHPCPKNKILYNLDKAIIHIMKQKEVIVVEAEKSVMQLWSKGIYNVVAIGGHQLSKTHVRKLAHLGVKIVIAYDKGVEIGRNGVIDKSFYNNEFDKFMKHQEVYCIYDKTNILEDKESPSDSFEKWKFLYDNKFKVRG